MVHCLWFIVYCSWFIVDGLGFRVQGLGFRACEEGGAEGVEEAGEGWREWRRAHSQSVSAFVKSLLVTLHFCKVTISNARGGALCSLSWPTGVPGMIRFINKERIFIELMTSDRKLQASREGSK